LQAVYFAGNAPAGSNAIAYSTLYPGELNAIVYHLAGTTGFDTNFYPGSIQVWYPGQLQVEFSPTNAFYDGAAWQVDGGSVWQTNGGMIGNLSAGLHTINFKSIPGWIAPPDETVLVDSNFITAATGGSYFPLPGGPSHTTFQVLHTFDANEMHQGGSAVAPILVSNTLYGVTMQGGSFNEGSIFSINTDGTGYTNLYSFTDEGASEYFIPNGSGGLLRSGNVLYGSTYGTVYRINLDGTGFAILCTNLEGVENGMVLVSNTLYAAAANGGNTNSGGMVFAVNTDGTCFRMLHAFDRDQESSYPQGGLVAAGNTLYGDTFFSLGGYNGSIFAIQTDGTGYTIFPNHGAYVGTLALSGNILYGLNYFGGLFGVHTDGTDYTGLPGPSYQSEAGVVIAGKTLYGMTIGGGSQFNPGYFGTVFAAGTDVAVYTNLYTFSASDYSNAGGGPDGANPIAPVLVSGTTLYGATAAGGTNGNGTLFMISYPHPQLGMNVSGTNLIFSWPSGTAGAGYDLFSVQSTTNLASPGAWCTLPMATTLANRMNTVTNPVPGVATFYRLSQ
jgi:uncharacterized repeat protein (TIGR03803 family)